MQEAKVNLNEEYLVQVLEQSEVLREGQEKAEGRWDDDQHHRFLQGLFKYGKNWKEIQAIVATRICSQVRSHAQKYFIKLQKIIKDRKKQKNKLTELTDIEKEILSKFTEDDITSKTPQILANLIRNSCLMPKSKQSEKQCVAHQQTSLNFTKPAKKTLKTKEKEKQQLKPKQIKADEMDKDEQNSAHRNQSIINSYYDQDQYEDKSFFRRLVEHNPEHFRQGKDFMDFIDFYGKHGEQLQKHEEMESSQTTRNRRSSFTLVDELQNDQKLKQAIQKIKSGQKCQN